MVQTSIRGSTALRIRAFTGKQWRCAEDAERVIYVAAAPWSVSEPWTGATVFLSGDDGETWSRAGSVAQPGVIGVAPFAASQLSVSVSGAWDASSALEVYVPGSALQSISEDDARDGLANVLMVGSEILAFASAEALGGSRYILTGLARGLRGTDAYGHAESEDVTGLSDALASVPLSCSDVAGAVVIVAVASSGQTIDEAARVSLFVPPIPDRVLTTEPQPVRDLLAESTGHGILLRWEPLPTPDLDYYEIRRGTRWHCATVVARSMEPRIALDPVATDEHTYHVRARYTGGLWSPEGASVTIQPDTPAGSDLVTTYTGTGSSWPGAESSVGLETLPEGGLAMSEGYYTESFDTSPVDAGAVSNWLWLVEVDSFEQDLRPWDQLPIHRMDSIEARVWLMDGREVSANHPGADLDTAWDDYVGPVDELSAQGLHCYGWEGNYGNNTRILVLARFDTDGAGSWTDWAPFSSGRRRAQKIQLRLQFDRWSLNYQRTCTRARVEVRS